MDLLVMEELPVVEAVVKVDIPVQVLAARPVLVLVLAKRVVEMVVHLKLLLLLLPAPAALGEGASRKVAPMRPHRTRHYAPAAAPGPQRGGV